MTAEAFHKFLQSSIQLPTFPIVRPFNWAKVFMTISTIVMSGLVASLIWPQIQKVVTDKNIWTLACLVFILLFTSGYMYNAIRHTPFTQPNGSGGFNYIAPGFQNQFGVETQIVASICISTSFNEGLIIDGVLALATVALVYKAPTIRDPTSQFAVIMIWSGGILFMYSFLMYVFRIKNGGYPFKILF
jgi:oligosaccharyltransferase complex subunit gamma